MTDMEAILDLTPSDFNALLRGYRLRRADSIAQMLEDDMLISKMNATTDKGKPKYKPKEVFDHKKEVRRILDEEGALPKVDKEKVARFAQSKKYAEDVLNKKLKFEES